MDAEEFWEQFRARKIVVAIRNREDQYAFWEAASAAGIQTLSKHYSLAEYPWAIFSLSGSLTGWTGGRGFYHPDTYMGFEDVTIILSGREEIELCAEGLESIL